jgi:hypothetical protein
LLLEDLVDLLLISEKPKSINTWSRPAITRKEFNEWMTISNDDDLDFIERKIRAVRHPQFDGPFLKVGKHIFKYQHPDHF